jgi:hypothetical protein
MGRTVSRQDCKVVQVKRQTCARVSSECKRRLTVLDERMAVMNDAGLLMEKLTNTSVDELCNKSYY